MRLKTLLLLLMCVPAYGQNWAVRTFATVTNTDPYRVQGGPTNWAAEWKHIGTNVSVSFPYSFVGDYAARSTWEATRVAAYDAWKNTTYTPAETNRVFMAESNRNWMMTQRDLIKSNAYWWSTNRQVETTTTLSNKLNQLLQLRQIEDGLGIK